VTASVAYGGARGFIHHATGHYPAQSRPLVKAAISSSGIDDYARVALLRAFDKEPRLLAAVDYIARQRAKSIGAMAVESHN